MRRYWIKGTRNRAICVAWCAPMETYVAEVFAAEPDDRGQDLEEVRQRI